MFKGLFFAIILIINLQMKLLSKIIKFKITFLISIFSFSHLLADNHNIYETLEKFKKILKL